MKVKAEFPYGFINVDKPSGITSFAVVNAVKKLTGVPCGHLGTLDPLASGVLPVGIGNATRLFDYFLEKKKRYVAEFTFGQDSDTLDCTGEVVVQGRIPTAAEIEAVLPAFVGELDQIPPRYSAKNVNGRRSYDLAREGVEFELPPKRVKIYSVELLGKVEGKEGAYHFAIECGGGTYIRSLARDIAAALDTKGLMSALRREKSGAFALDTAVKAEDLTKELILEKLIPTDSVLPFPCLYLTEDSRVFNGVPVAVEGEDGEYKLYRGGQFYGLAEVKDGRARTKVKLC